MFRYEMYNANKSIPKFLFVKKQNVIYNHIRKRSTANSELKEVLFSLFSGCCELNIWGIWTVGWNKTTNKKITSLENCMGTCDIF